MRSNLDDNIITNPRVLRGLQFGTTLLAISADQTLVAGMPTVLGFDPGNTTRVITLEAVPASDGFRREIVHYGAGTGNLTIKNPAGTTIGTLYPGWFGIVSVINGAWAIAAVPSGLAPAQGNVKETISLYTKLADLVNTNVLAVAVPYNFTLVSVGFRVRTPATTAAKLATLTAQVNGVAVTGGVISLTSANATPTNTLVAGTAITAGNTGTATQTVGAAISAVTAFVEGDGYLEMVLNNTT